MKKRKREPLFLSWLIYCGFRLLLALYKIIPPSKAYGLGAGVASFFYPLFPGRRKLAIDNLLRTGVAKDRADADRIARKAFGHLAGHLCEAMKVGDVVTPENWREHLTFDGPRETYDFLFERKDTPILILTGHHGMWEAAAPIFSLSRSMIAVARKMNNPFVDRFLKRHHFRGAITIISKKQGFTPQILRDWKRTCSSLTLVMDQRTNRKQGVLVDFLGIPAYTHTSPARLHLSSGVPMLVGSFIREAPFRYKIVTGAPIRFQKTGDRDADTLAVLSEVNARLGAIIRRYPEQYLWAHHRWRV